MKKEVDRVRYEARRKGLRLSKLRSEEKYNLKKDVGGNTVIVLGGRLGPATLDDVREYLAGKQGPPRRKPRFDRISASDLRD